MTSVKEKAKEIIGRIVEANDCYLIDVAINLQGSRQFIKVVAESDKGINIEQIVRITKEIKADVEFDALMPDTYQLEVTSPGVDYPLKTRRDFLRNTGRTVKIRIEINGVKSSVDGKIVSADETSVVLETTKGSLVFAYSTIEFGKVLTKW
ncbi:MAG: hypothetical protein PHW79_05145 [Candidatus Marinimicrobia bacterium]|nr:hypothetical protein [Candidatus Neomarinimicrobiota bacterium]